MEKNSKWIMYNITNKNTDKSRLEFLNKIINEKKITRAEIFEILDNLAISEILTIPSKMENVKEQEFKKDWLLEEVKSTSLLSVEYWKNKLKLKKVK